eukprot:gene1116-411_t
MRAPGLQRRHRAAMPRGVLHLPRPVARVLNSSKLKPIRGFLPLLAIGCLLGGVIGPGIRMMLVTQPVMFSRYGAVAPDCWDACGQQPGECARFCGAGAKCCQKGLAGGDCGMDDGGVDRYQCVDQTESRYSPASLQFYADGRAEFCYSMTWEVFRDWTQEQRTRVSCMNRPAPLSALPPGDHPALPIIGACDPDCGAEDSSLCTPFPSLSSLSAYEWQISTSDNNIACTATAPLGCHDVDLSDVDCWKDVQRSLQSLALPVVMSHVFCWFNALWLFYGWFLSAVCSNGWNKGVAKHVAAPFRAMIRRTPRFAFATTGVPWLITFVGWILSIVVLVRLSGELEPSCQYPLDIPDTRELSYLVALNNGFADIYPAGIPVSRFPPPLDACIAAAVLMPLSWVTVALLFTKDLYLTMREYSRQPWRVGAVNHGDDGGDLEAEQDVVIAEMGADPPQAPPRSEEETAEEEGFAEHGRWRPLAASSALHPDLNPLPPPSAKHQPAATGTPSDLQSPGNADTARFCLNCGVRAPAKFCAGCGHPQPDLKAPGEDYPSPAGAADPDDGMVVD